MTCGSFGGHGVNPGTLVVSPSVKGRCVSHRGTYLNPREELGTREILSLGQGTGLKR